MQSLAGHEYEIFHEGWSGPDLDPDKPVTLHKKKHGRLFRKGEKVKGVFRLFCFVAKV